MVQRNRRAKMGYNLSLTEPASVPANSTTYEPFGRRTMNKRTLAALTAIALAATLTACGQQSQTSADKAKEAASKAVDATKEAAKATMEAAKDATKEAADKAAAAAASAADATKDAAAKSADAAKEAADKAAMAAKEAAAPKK